MDIRFMEDKWGCEGGFKVLKNFFTFVVLRELRRFFK